MPESPPRIMIVDDEAIMRRLIGAVLNKLGCEVLAEEETGSAAMKTFRAHRPDITFLDINLGDSNGLDVLKRIRALSPDAVVVMLTAMTDTTVAEHCLTNGAQGFIVKGRGPADLEKAIAEQLKIAGY